MKNKNLKKVLVAVLMMSMTIGIMGCSKNEANNSDEKVIKVGCEATTPGWIQTDKEGKLTGYDYDVWQEIGKRTGWNVAYA